jgi:hypothetical protein
MVPSLFLTVAWGWHVVTVTCTEASWDFVNKPQTLPENELRAPPACPTTRSALTNAAVIAAHLVTASAILRRS